MQDSLPSIPQNNIRVDEHSIILHSENNGGFNDQLENLAQKLTDALSEHGLGAESIIFCRLFLSDVRSQYDPFLSSPLYQKLSSACCAVVGQPPLGTGDIALQAYCLDGEGLTKKAIANLKEDGYSALLVETGRHQCLWVGGMSAPNADGSYAQTDEIFDNYVQLLSDHGFEMNPDTIRTWIFVDDVDNNYAGMVDSRRALFEDHNLTSDTNFIASTGIEAQLPVDGAIVGMDAVAVKTLGSDQVTFMEAPDNMCPTHVYGVTFERGTKVTYGDRAHIYVSGTASIDTNGDVLHIGDITSQTHRTVDNVEALLKPYDAELVNASYLLIYLRNPEDYESVKSVVDERVPDSVPRIFLRGPVCRPTWLVEIEGFFAKPTTAPYLPF